MSESNVLFGKVVASPTTSSWSQAYNAGGLFAVISLKTLINDDSEKDKDEEKNHTLQILGKDLISTLEQEYFVLEEKNLESIKNALSPLLEKIPDTVSANILIASVVKNVLYVFVYGQGKVVLKRGEKMGVILENKDELTSASGFLEHNDTVVLGTDAFFTIVSPTKLKNALEKNTPSDFSEILMPEVHKHEEGAAASLMMLYTAPSSLEPDTTEEDLDILPPSPPIPKKPFISSSLTLPSFSLPKLPFSFSLPTFSSSKKIYLVLAIILLCILGFNMYASVAKKQQQKQNEEFGQMIISVQKKYEEGENLLSLNKTLAYEDFKEAQSILEKNKKTYQNNKDFTNQIDSLSKKISNALSSSTSSVEANTKELKGKEDLLLYMLQKDSFFLYATQDQKTIYVLATDGIYTIDKKSESKKQIIKKDWKNVAGIGIFIGNLYTAETSSNQVLKFVSQETGFGKSNYFGSSASEDLSQTVSLGIDGSVWILNKNGSIRKYTRGKRDDFSLTKLEKPLSSPTRIVTDSDFQNIYILDNGNSRIVVVKKDGTFQEQYNASILKNAKDFTVSEKDKKLHILSNNKLWEITLR